MSQNDLQLVSSGFSKGNGNLPWEIRRWNLSEGLSAGVEVVELKQGEFSFRVLPTRGMGIWDAYIGEQRIGWNSPVKAPVHPAFVNAKSRNGLGWLDGFNELMCRCGLSYFGPPGTDSGMESPVESDVTLHGKIANLPAHSISLIQGENDEIGLKGIVDESSLFGPQLRLESTITTRLGEKSILVRDRITNLGSSATELSLLYHTNIGPAILGEGSRFTIPAKQVLPNNVRSAEDVDTYETYLAPTAGYAEQVYFFETIADAEGKSIALLESPDREIGFSVEFTKEQLPCFTQWKATQPLQDGYVTGLEPGTNFPNFKSFEREQNRILQLAAGETYEVDLKFSVHTNAEEVSEIRKRIAAIQSTGEKTISSAPELPYCQVK